MDINKIAEDAVKAAGERVLAEEAKMAESDRKIGLQEALETMPVKRTLMTVCAVVQTAAIVAAAGAAGYIAWQKFK